MGTPSFCSATIAWLGSDASDIMGCSNARCYMGCAISNGLMGCSANAGYVLPLGAPTTTTTTSARRNMVHSAYEQAIAAAARI